MNSGIEAMPPPIASLVGPTHLSPSLIAKLDACILSVAHGLRGTEQLPSNPYALLGSILHRTIQKLSVREVSLTWDEAFGAFEEELANEPVPLRKSLEPGAFSRRTALLRSWLNTRKAGTGSARSGGYRTRLSGTSLSTGNEVRLSSDTLGLQGVADRLERVRDEIHIVDVKTGAIFDANGEVRPEYVVQLRLYALLVEDHEPSADVRLWLEGQERLRVPWGPEARSEIGALLGRVRRLLPEQSVVSARRLAAPGEPCRFCRIRHRCDSYLEHAPRWWRGNEDFRPPPDIWGQLEDIRSDGNELILTLRDGADRPVRIFGVRDRGAFEKGQRLFFFGLVPLGTKANEAHPRNFREMAGPFGGRDATDLRIYRS